MATRKATRVDYRGRVCLPKEVRRALGIKCGARLECRVRGETIILAKAGANGIQFPQVLPPHCLPWPYKK